MIEGPLKDISRSLEDQLHQAELEKQNRLIIEHLNTIEQKLDLVINSIRGEASNEDKNT